MADELEWKANEEVGIQFYTAEPRADLRYLLVTECNGKSNQWEVHVSVGTKYKRVTPLATSAECLSLEEAKLRALGHFLIQ